VSLNKIIWLFTKKVRWCEGESTQDEVCTRVHYICLF